MDAASHLGRTGRGAKYPSPFNMPIRINVLSERGSPRSRWMQRSRVRGGDKGRNGIRGARHSPAAPVAHGTTQHGTARHGASLRLRLASQRVFASQAAADGRDDRSFARSDSVMHV